MILSHSFGAPMKGTATIHAYDLQPGLETLFQYFELTTDNSGPAIAGVGIQDFDAFCYQASASGSGPNQNCGSFPQTTTTNIPRTAGWRTYTLTVGATSTVVLIDGQQVFELPGDFTFNTVNIQLFGPGGRPNTTMYVDDFSIEATSADVPEPSAFAFTGLCLFGLHLARKRAIRSE